jgi:energy-coupling factor transport system substrate-specific component
MRTTVMRTLDTRSLLLISVAVVIDVVASATVNMLKIPLYLDSIGTVIVAVLAGPLAGAVAGGLSVFMGGLMTNPAAIPFVPVGMMIGAVAGGLARAGGFRTWWLALLSGAAIAMPTTLLAVPIIVFLYGGVSGTGADFTAAFLVAVGSTLVKSVALANLGASLIDKSLTGLIAFTIANRLPLRLLASYRFFAHSNVSAR